MSATFRAWKGGLCESRRGRRTGSETGYKNVTEGNQVGPYRFPVGSTFVKWESWHSFEESSVMI